MTAITPPALLRGDTIAVIAPSARINHIFPWRVARGVAFLESKGFSVKVIHDLDLPYEPLSANIAARANEFHEAFLDKSVKAIICCIGGSTANELLPALDPQVVRNNPKIFVGSSDITLLHHFCYVNCLRTFYGPSIITQFGEWPNALPFTWSHFQQATMQPQVLGPMPRSEDFTDEFCDWMKEPELIASNAMIPRTMRPARGWKWLKHGKAEGILWGGCLPSILQLMSTKWNVAYTGKIALIELPEGDAPGTGFPVERALWNFNDLRLRGVFDEIAGLIIGRPYIFTPDEEVEWETAVVRALEGCEFPVLAGVDVGHTDPMLTVPLGAPVSLDSSNDEWRVLEAVVV